MDLKTVTELLSALVSIGSVNPCTGPVEHDWQGEKRMAEFVADWLRRNSVDAKLDEFETGRCNVAAEVQVRKEAETIVFTAHSDTVSIHWPDDARFKPVVKDGRLYGLGSCDDKASLAAFMLALAEGVRRATLRMNVILLATADEEHHFSGIRRAISTGLEADMAVVGEPTRLNIVRRHKAVNRWVVNVTGRSAHGSTPHLGDNAIYKAARVVMAMQEYSKGLSARPSSELLTPPTLNLGTIRGGLQANSVPDFCRIELDRRMLPEEKPDEVEKEVRAAIADVLPNPSDWEMTHTTLLPSLDTRGGERVVQLMEKVCRKVLGTARVTGVDYGTEAGVLSRAGIPAVVFGPGDAALVHAPGEYVELNQVQSAVQVITELITADD